MAVDIGGTFTDVVLERGEERLTRKVLTTTSRPEAGVLAATEGEISGRRDAVGVVGEPSLR